MAQSLDLLFSGLEVKKALTPEEPGHAGDGTFSPPGADAGDGDNGSSSSSSSNGAGGGDGDGDSGADRERWQHAAPMLKVGERLVGVLVSPDGTSGLFADHGDASVRLYRHTHPGPAGGGEEPGVLSTLFRSEPRLVEKVKSIRRDVIEDAEEREARGGQEEKRGVWKRVKGWLPYGKDGFIKTGQRKHALENWGQVYVTVTNRGRLVSTPKRFPGFPWLRSV